ncbi:hypothetical protein H8959_013455 [Pygathrix nigripes]
MNSSPWATSLPVQPAQTLLGEQGVGDTERTGMPPSQCFWASRCSGSRAHSASHGQLQRTRPYPPYIGVGPNSNMCSRSNLPEDNTLYLGSQLWLRHPLNSKVGSTGETFRLWGSQREEIFLDNKDATKSQAGGQGRGGAPPPRPPLACQFGSAVWTPSF